MVLEDIVTPLVHWLWYQMSTQTGRVVALSSADLANATLHARKDLRDRIIPSPPPAKPHTAVQFLPRPPEAAALPPATNQVVSTEDRWGGVLNILLGMCNMTEPADLSPIWDVIAPLSRDRDQSAMEAACRRASEHLRFRSPRISHSAAVLVLGLAFYYEDPDSVGNAINVFLFPDLPPLASSEAELLTRRWGAILGGGALTSFADRSLLLAKQRVK